MNFTKILQDSINDSIDPVLKLVSNKFEGEVNFNELKELLFYAYTPPRQTCSYRITRGKNKGDYCKEKALSNEYCKKHQTQAAKAIAKIGMKVPEQKPTISKTRQQIIDMLSTAVPQEEVILKRHELGLIHENTEIIFDEEFMVIGKLNINKLCKLNEYDVNECERRGWKYNIECYDLEN